MKLRASLPFGLVALTVLAYAAQGTVLKRTPKVGDKATYKMTGKLDFQGNDITVGGTMTDEITKVDEKAFTTKSTTKLTMNMMGNEVPVPDQASTSVTSLDGTVLEVKQGEAADASAHRLANLNTLLLTDKPVAVNDTWTLETKKDDKAGTPGLKITYKLVGDEKIGKYDTYHINATGGETEGDTPTKIKSDYWIEKSTGVLVQAKSQLTDVVYSAGVPAVSGTMDVVRQD